MDTSTIRFDTGQIGALRVLLARIPALRASMGDIAQFRLVVDANFVIQELIHRVRAPTHGPSAFEELVKATVIDVFAPKWLETELLMSAIAKAAKRSKVSEEELRAKWLEFRQLLKWDETLSDPGSFGSECCDPKDLPYVQLQQKLNADGILSKDAHIARLGGHPLTLDFVFSTRRYARSVVTTVSIRLMGFVLPAAALMVLADLLRRTAQVFAALPAPFRMLIVVGALFALVHPVSRKWIAGLCIEAAAGLESALQALMPVVAQLSAMSASAASEATLQLHEAKRVTRRRTPRRRRIRARRAVRVGTLA